MFRRGGVDLIVLDIGMPEMDGLEVCRQIRKSSEVPILFLSARDEEIDRILRARDRRRRLRDETLLGAELVARQRHPQAQRRRRTEGGALAQGRISLDAGRHHVAWDEVPVSLTALEFSLLQALLARPDFVFSREQLMAAAYGPNIHVADRTIDSHVRNIRAKFAEAGCANVIATVHGVGFRLGDVQ